LKLYSIKNFMIQKMLNNFISKAVLEVSVISSYVGVFDPEKILKDWIVTSFTPESMKLQLYFTKELLISQFSEMDKLEI